MEEYRNEGWVRIGYRFGVPCVNWDGTQEIAGIIVEKKEVERNGRQQRLVVLYTSIGNLAVCCAGKLGVLYDLEKGAEVRIVNKGAAQTQSGRRSRNFEIWVRS